MRRFLVASVLVLLAGCVPVQPFESPVAKPFASPLAQPERQRLYLPLVSLPAVWAGVSQDLQYRDCETLYRLGATWHYDWSPYPLDCEGVEGVPMLWAPGDGSQYPVPMSRHLLVGNECDLAGQCNTDPEATAVWWHEVQETYPDRLLIGPNASQLGLAWLLDWHAAYIRLYGEQPRLWALGVHCYGTADTCIAWFQQMAVLAHSWTASGKLWVTEWATPGCFYATEAAAGFAAAVQDADRLLAWLRASSDIERQAWFVARLDQDFGQRCATMLVAPDGALTTFGAWYSQAQPRDE